MDKFLLKRPRSEPAFPEELRVNRADVRSQRAAAAFREAERQLADLAARLDAPAPAPNASASASVAIGAAVGSPASGLGDAIRAAGAAGAARLVVRETCGERTTEVEFPVAVETAAAQRVRVGSAMTFAHRCGGECAEECGGAMEVEDEVEEVEEVEEAKEVEEVEEVEEAERPPLPDLPEIPRANKDRLEGKYRSRLMKGCAQTVVFYKAGARQAMPCCWHGTCTVRVQSAFFCMKHTERGVAEEARPPLPDLPLLPPLLDPETGEARPEGKYISRGRWGRGNPTVVFYKAGARHVDRCCWYGDCKTRPTFSQTGTFGGEHTLFCKEHKDACAMEEEEEEEEVEDGAERSPLPDLPLLPKRDVNGMRPVGKYIGRGRWGKDDPRVMAIDDAAKDARPCCWKGDCMTWPSTGLPGDPRPTLCGSCAAPPGLADEVAIPPLPDLPMLPPLVDPETGETRLEGKYISRGSGRNGFASRVVFYKTGAEQASKCCWHGTCEERPSYGPIDTFGSKYAIFCKGHADPDQHEDVISKRCEHIGCKTHPIFGPIDTFGSKYAIFCEDHMDPRIHENVASKRCEHAGCKTCASLGPIGTFGPKHALFCKEHADRDLHEDVINKRCEHPGCKTCPLFGPIGKLGRKHAIFCGEHASRELHEDIVSRRCEHPGCKTHPSHGPIGTFGSAHALFCKEHADSEKHVNVVTKRCEHDRCEITASFGPIGTFGLKYALFCKEHADPVKHTNVTTKRCEHDGCETFACFPGKDDAPKAFCVKHAFEAGTVAAYNPRASMIGCRAACALATEGLVFEHEHLNTSTSPPQWEGAEVEGLIPGRRFRPDGVLYEGGTITTVFFFHGNLWHGANFPPNPSLTLPSQTPHPTGFPPEHELYDTEIALPERSKKDGHRKIVNTKERYDKTMHDTQLFVDQGYKVCYLWEFEYIAARRAKTPIKEALRWL